MERSVDVEHILEDASVNQRNLFGIVRTAAEERRRLREEIWRCRRERPIAHLTQNIKELLATALYSARS